MTPLRLLTIAAAGITFDLTLWFYPLPTLAIALTLLAVICLTLQRQR